MISRDWSPPTVLMPPDFIEDPVLHRDADGLWLFYSRGPSLQDQRIYERRADGPLGPLGGECLALDLGTHTRIERGRINARLALFTASWPGPPTGGIMAFERFPWGDTRSLILTVQPGTDYSFIAANPCVVDADEPGAYDLLFEGCTDDTCQWNLFRATWRPGSLAVVDPEPLFAGANPSLFDEDGVRHLVYSRLTEAGYSAGFETCVVTQEIR